jgi:deoxyribodipyrimidine photolyase-like uncharacterized protein
MYISDGMVYHSMISTGINFGLLTPFEVIAKIASADTDINNKE